MKSYLTIVAMLALGCGGGSGTDTPSGGGGSGGTQGGGPAATCFNCVAQSCNSEAVATFGPDFQNGNYAGACPNFIPCAYAPNGNADLCLQQESDACKASFATLNACLGPTTCGTACNSNGTSGGNQNRGPSAACVSCLAQNCASQSVVAYGPNYQSGDYTSGVCPHFISCAYSKESTPASAGPCAQQDGTDCATAFAALGACLGKTTCGTACTTGNNTGG